MKIFPHLSFFLATAFAAAAISSLRAQPANSAAFGSTVMVWSTHTTVRERVDAGVNERIELWSRTWIVSPTGTTYANTNNYGLGGADGSSTTTVTLNEVGRWSYWSTDGGAIDSFRFGDGPSTWFMFPHNPPNGVGYGGAGTQLGSYIDVAPTTTYTLTTNVLGSGFVSGGGSYSAGATATVTATPGSGFLFSGWQGALAGTANPASLTMNSDKSVTATFAAQNSAPTIAWTSSPTSAASGQNYTITAHGHDADGNLMQVNVWKNGAPFAFVGGGNGTDNDGGNATSDTGPATITFTAQAVDGAGATSATISHTVTITVANRAPTIAWNTTPGTVASGQNYTISAHGHDADGNLAQVNVWKNGAAFAFTGGGNGTDNDSGNSTADTGPATVTYTADAVDGNGVRSGTISQTVTVSAPPTVTATISVSPANATAPGSATITWSSANATAVSVSGNGVGSSAASGSNTVNGLPAGTYTYTITAQGPGGPVTQTATFTVNPSLNSAPTIAWNTTPGTVASGQNYTISAHGHDADGNLTQVNVWKNGAAFAFASGGNGTDNDSGNTTSDTGPATITFTANAVDANGATSATITQTVTVSTANSAPTISWNTTPGTVASGQSFTISAHGHDANGNLTQVNVWKNGAAFAFAGGGNGTDNDSGNMTSDTGPATITFTANAVDANGASSPTISQTVTVAAPAGVSATISASPSSTTAPGTATITWSSVNATSVAVSGPSLGSTATNGSQTVSGLAVGTHTYTITVQGSGGPVTQSATLTVTTAASVTASITASPTAATVPGTTTISWASANATSVAVTGNGLNSSAPSGTQTITGLPVGTYSYTITAQGPNGPATQTAIFTVTSAAAVAGAIAASPTTSTAPASTTISWSTSNTTSVAVSGPGLSSATTSGSQTVTGLAVGSHTYTLTAQGPGGPITRTATFTVSAAPPGVAGFIAASPNAAVEPGATTISWSTSNATAVAVIGPGVASSAASGAQTVTGLTTGTHTFTLTAQGNGGPITRTATVTVSAAATFLLTTVATAGGSVTPGGTYPAGTIVTISATPDATHRFTNWTGDASGGATTIPITMDRAKFAQANFTGKTPQTIAFDPPGDRGLTSPPFTLTATATSGLPVSFTLLGGPAILTGSSVQITGAGSITLQANQPGDAFYLPAAPVNQTFNAISAATLKYRGQSRTLLRDGTTREAPPYVLEKP